jgi:aminopeptidase
MTLDFNQLLKNYADLIVQVGLNLRAGQRLMVRAPVETAPLVRLIVASAYQTGARLVDVIWGDDLVTLARFQHAPRDSFEEFPVWRAEVITDYARSGDAILSVHAEDPDLLSEQDPDLVATAQRTAYKHSQEYLGLITRNSTNWCVVSVPIPSWASKVFPNHTPIEQVERLWDAIFDVCRLKQDDPVAAWNSHLNQLLRRAEYLNTKQYTALKYTGPGTDLTIGLPEGHIWISGQSTAANGITFTANLPTEEVFTLPHRERAEGVVSASRPLSYSGTLIEDLCLTFEGGMVASATASKGEATLQKLLETDEGARRLGEVALLANSTPISQSGILFYNTLFDENAASHLALGKAYAFTMHGGEALSDEDFQAAGGNHSLVHEDFMIGSDEIDIDAILPGGAVEPLMRAGEWAFDI